MHVFDRCWQFLCVYFSACFGHFLPLDQTPTPTRFLRNCEEAGLFQELGNPFDQDFQSATTKTNGASDGSDDVTNDSLGKTTKTMFTA